MLFLTASWTVIYYYMLSFRCEILCCFFFCFPSSFLSFSFFSFFPLTIQLSGWFGSDMCGLLSVRSTRKVGSYTWYQSFGLANTWTCRKLIWVYIRESVLVSEIKTFYRFAVTFCVVFYLFLSFIFLFLTIHLFGRFGSDMCGLLSIRIAWKVGSLHVVSELWFSEYLNL